MLKHTFKWGEATITVRTRTGNDVIWWRVIFARVLPEASDPQYAYWLTALSTFVPMLTQSEIKGKLPFEWPSLSADSEAIRAAAQAMLAEHHELLSQWETALEAVDTPPGDSKTQPPQALTAEEKKAKS